MFTIISLGLLGICGLIFYVGHRSTKRRMLAEASTTYSQYTSNSVRNINDSNIYDNDDNEEVLDGLVAAAILDEVLDDGTNLEQDETVSDTEVEETLIAVGDNSGIPESKSVDNTPAPSWNSPTVSPTPTAPSYESPSAPAPSYSPPAYEAPSYSSNDSSDSSSSSSSSDD